MFVRKKKNKSGVISVQVIDKSSGKYRLVKTIGSSADNTVVERFFNEGRDWILKYTGSLELDFTDYQRHTQLVLKGIEQIIVYGPELLLGKLLQVV